MSSVHHARVLWERDARPFEYERYSRAHRVEFGSGTAIPMSAAPEFHGDAALPNPEELLVAALSSCHMLTFLAICARKGLIVERYEDEASGVLERRPGERTRVTRVTLRPRTTFAVPAPDAATVRELHRQAHLGCFLANSVTTEVSVEPREA